MRRAFTVIAALLCCGGALSQEDDAGRKEGFLRLPALVQQALGPGARREVFESQVRRVVEHLDHDSNGVLDKDDAMEFQRQRIAAGRAATFAALLAMDTDGDGKVSRDELRAGLARGLPGPLGVELSGEPERDAGSLFELLDRDRDGTLDYEEMRGVPVPSVPDIVGGLVAMVGRSPSASTERIVKAAVESGFDLVDADRDGVIDEVEATAARPRRE